MRADSSYMDGASGMCMITACMLQSIMVGIGSLIGDSRPPLAYFLGMDGEHSRAKVVRLRQEVDIRAGGASVERECPGTYNYMQSIPVWSLIVRDLHDQLLHLTGSRYLAALFYFTVSVANAANMDAAAALTWVTRL